MTPQQKLAALREIMHGINSLCVAALHIIAVSDENQQQPEPRPVDKAADIAYIGEQGG